MYGYLTPTGGFTIEVWSKRDAVPPGSTYECIASQFTQAAATWTSSLTTNGRQFFWGFSPTTGAMYVTASKENGTAVMSWTDPSPSGYEDDNAWHHFGIRLAANKTTFTMFVDGVPVATATASAAIDWAPGILTLGAIYAPHLGQWGWHMYRQALAYVTVRNAALTDNRILEHYTAASGGTVYYGDNEVQRLNRIFDWTDTPTICRDLDAPLSSLQGIQVSGTNALDALNQTANDAGGYAFADGQTWIQYHNKRHRYNRFSLFTFAESLGSSVEAGIDMITDDERIWNDVRGKRPYGGSYRMRDEVSISEYGRKTHEFSLAITSSEELRNTVGWLLSRYGTKHLRVSGVTVRAESSDLIEEATTGRIEIGDHIVLDELPDWSPLSRMELAVEGMSLDANFRDRTWAMTFNLTPAEFDRVFQIGVSALGSNDKVAL